MRKVMLASACALAVSLGGCAAVQKLENSFAVLSSASVSPQAVVVAVNSFDAVQATATNYLRLPKCTGTNGPICRDPAISVKVIQAVKAGRTARNNLEAFMTAHPGQLGDAGLYDALQASLSTLESIVSQYGAAK